MPDGVCHRFGAFLRRNSTDSSEARQFIVETSVYDASKTSPIQFSVVCFLENTKRWQKVKTPPSGAFLSVTAKLAGRTVDTNRLALRVLDLAYLPRPNSGAAMSTPTTTPPSKRSRWDGRAPSSTPSKKQRTSTLQGCWSKPRSAGGLGVGEMKKGGLYCRDGRLRKVMFGVSLWKRRRKTGGKTAIESSQHERRRSRACRSEEPHIRRRFRSLSEGERRLLEGNPRVVVHALVCRQH